MKKLTKLSVQWFYNLLENGECELVDFKEQLDDKVSFGKSQRSFSPNYEEMAKDVVAFANKKGGFIIIGIVDKTKEINPDFAIVPQQEMDLIKNIQSRTQPSITLATHRLTVDKKELLVIEVPFTNYVHCTTKGEYLIRNYDGNRIIEPNEMATLMAEKGQLIYDQKVWKLNYSSVENDTNGFPIPGWQDIERTRKLFVKIQSVKPQSPYLKKSSIEFCETLGFIEEEDDTYRPTTTGILFIGNQKALRQLPYSQIKYIRYKPDGTYTPYEYTGDLVSIADACFQQLKSEINLKEFQFGLFREYIEDYPEVVLRELLINAIAHRDYSRQMVVEIRKYDNYIEFESPGIFPQGIDATNYLRKTNPRNPNIMDVFREVKYAEKAGSGFDKIFTALLSKGKKLPVPVETEHSVIFRVNADVYSEKLIELSLRYKELTRHDIDLEKLLVLSAIHLTRKISYKELTENKYVNVFQLRKILQELEELEFIETTGRTSGVKYIIHKKHRIDAAEEKEYLLSKRQERHKQIETLLRYIDEFAEIDNEKAREILLLPDNQDYYVSRLFAEMKEKSLIVEARRGSNNKMYYGRAMS
jgi:ATP-dependent DNA helicase RecG